MPLTGVPVRRYRRVDDDREIERTATTSASGNTAVWIGLLFDVEEQKEGKIEACQRGDERLPEMLRIRDEQLQLFSTAASIDFENRMVIHLRKFFPQHCKALHERGIRDVIQHAIRRAASYGIVTERDVCKYTDLVFAFDRDFDRDPKLPWAARVLGDPELTDPTERVNRLFDEALWHVRQAGGIDDSRR